MYEPGSVIKPLVVAGLLESGRLLPNELIDSPMTLRVGAQTFRDVARHESVLSVPDVLAYSSNSGMIHLGQRFAPAELYDWLMRFGIGQDLDLSTAYTRTGILNPWYRWVPQDQATNVIGQNHSTTALQLAAAYSIFANDGLYVPPRLTEDERAIQEAARSYAREKLLPRVVAAFRDVLADGERSADPVFFEVPWTPDAVSLLRDIASVVRSANNDGANFGLKIRAGGLSAELFPAPSDMARFITTCLEYEVPFKATAGLHHPIRHYRPEMDVMMHGFLNVMADAAAAVHGINQSVAKDLESAGPTSFFIFRRPINLSFEDDSDAPWRRNPPIRLNEVQAIDRLPSVQAASASIGTATLDGPSAIALVQMTGWKALAGLSVFLTLMSGVALAVIQQPGSNALDAAELVLAEVEEGAQVQAENAAEPQVRGALRAHGHRRRPL